MTPIPVESSDIKSLVESFKKPDTFVSHKHADSCLYRSCYVARSMTWME